MSTHLYFNTKILNHAFIDYSMYIYLNYTIYFNSKQSMYIKLKLGNLKTIFTYFTNNVKGNKYK